MINTQKTLWSILFAALIIRMVAMWMIPLTDTTEARYGEIARKMLETNNWITPLHDYKVEKKTCEEIACVELGSQNYGVPFWAKPPLSTWTSAASMKIFGVNEFAARLPALLFAIGILWLIFNWLRFRENHFNLIAVTTLATSFLFFGASATVMTDLSLLFCSVLAMVSFWRAVIDNHKNSGYLFFISLGIGLLAKGPLILVLVGLPTGLWTLIHGKLLIQWQRLPWIIGLCVMLAIAAPWYYLAEKSTPGFINYFIVGEHFNRFMVSGWTGDKYGHAHSEPLGMIWVYLIAGFLPWTFLLIHSFIKSKLSKNSKAQSNTPNKEWFSYLSLWTFMPLAFFTFAHNIIPPYALLCMPAAAILLSELFFIYTRKESSFDISLFRNYALGLLIVLFIGLCVFPFKPDVLSKRSEKQMIADFNHLKKSPDAQLYYFRERLYSADFYSHGTTKVLADFNQLEKLVDKPSPDYLAINKRWKNPEVAELLSQHFKKLSQINDFVLYEKCFPNNDCQSH